MTAGLAVVPQPTIFEARNDDAPQMAVIDDGEKYAIATDDTRLRDLFTADSGLVPIITAIEGKVRAFDLDVTTAKGRAEIRALAHKITRSKTYLDGIGKDMVAELKDLPRRIDANRKMMRDQLDALAERTRANLTAYEERTKAFSDRLNQIDGLTATLASATSAEIAAQIETLTNSPLTSEAWDGFLDEATAITRRTIPILTEMYAAKRTAEIDAAELARLRAEAAERDRKDADAQRIADAQERGRREAEATAERERQAAAGREAEARRATILAEQANRRAKDAEDRAAREAEQARAEATEAERKRVEDEARMEATAKALREANKEHTRQINSEALADIQSVIGLLALVPEEMGLEKIARAVTIAIIKGEVRHTSISY
jgi:paraquat-inducible protein B